MQFRYRMLLSIFIFLIFLIACGGPQRVEHEVRDPTGEPFPDPMFMLQTIDQERPIRITFFYVFTEYIEDLDGKKVPQKSYLDPRRHHHLKQESDVELVMRVLNPTNRHYKVYIKQKIDFMVGGDMQALHDVAESDMKYREYFKELPTWFGITKVSYLVYLTDETGKTIISTRGIGYTIQ